jgi:hypothetical protein
MYKAGHQFSPSPPLISVANEGWSIWNQGRKLPDAKTARLYPLIEDAHALLHWTRGHSIQPQRRLDPACITNIDFQACQEAMAALKIPHRHWITKQASENCSVGSTFRQWRKQETDTCPRCDLPGEDASHVLWCRAENSDAPWEANFTELISYLNKTNTHPSLITITDTRLRQFRNREGFELSPGPLEPLLRELLKQQDAIGWQNFLYGIPSKLWQIIQARHLRRTGQQNWSTKKWMKGFLKRLHQLAWEQWDHRNKVLYDPELRWQKRMKQQLEDAIMAESLRGPMDLPPGDQSHFAIPLADLLHKSWEYKKAWLANVSAARNRQARRRSQAADAIADSRARSALLHFNATGQLPGRAFRLRHDANPS